MATTTKKTTAKKATSTTKKATTAKKTTTKAAAKPAAKKSTTTKTTAAKTTVKKAAAAKPAPKVGGEITVNGNKIIQTVQKEFSKKFEYLTLCFIVDEDRGKFVNVRGINTARRISEVRKKISTKEISIHGRTKV